MPVTKQHTGRVVAAPARCKRYNIPDSELKGFGLRVEPPRQDGAGTKSWYAQAMTGSKRIYKTIGTVPEMSLAEAPERLGQAVERCWSIFSDHWGTGAATRDPSQL